MHTYPPYSLKHMQHMHALTPFLSMKRISLLSLILTFILSSSSHTCLLIYDSRIVARSIGYRLGLKMRKRRPLRHNEILESEFLASPRRVPTARAQILCEKAGMSMQELRHWWLRRQRVSRPCKLVRFEESFWRLIFYSCSFLWGASICFSSPHFWDTELLWVG